MAEVSFKDRWHVLGVTRREELALVSVSCLATIGSLIGDPARAAMLVTLMDGRALTAGELAHAAGVMPSTASGHLGRMLDEGLLALDRQGRHRYYRIASVSVANLIESMMSLSSELGEVHGRCKPVRTGPRDRAMRQARLCFDHLAGEIAVGVAASMVKSGHLDYELDGGALTPTGVNFLGVLGVLDQASKFKRANFCRPCLDWSERRPHLGGFVGRALYAAFVQKDWMRQPTSGRIVQITPHGVTQLHKHFNVEVVGKS